MHELPVTQGIISVALQAAQQNGAKRITAIDLVIGELASIVDDSVQFYFDLLSKDTIAAGATLRFRREPGTGKCWDCDYEFEARAPLTPFCPACGSARIHVSGGREFYLESIDIDDETPEADSNLNAKA
jgi:hydrogenase nickel incorporation protein HypA/HybF